MYDLKLEDRDLNASVNILTVVGIG